MQIRGTKTDRSLTLACIFILTALPFLGVPFAHALGTDLTNRYDKLSTNQSGAVAVHEVGFTPGNTTVPMGSFSLEFCSNDPLPNTPCTAPGGFDASGVVLDDQSGEVGFSIAPETTANKIVMTRPAAVPSGTPTKYHFSNIINPSTPGTYYIRLQTFTSTDGTGANIEAGGIAFGINGVFTVSTEVPPYLNFCFSVAIAGDDCSSATTYLIDMGEFSVTQTRSANSQFVVETNAPSGYSVTLTGTTLTSGNNTITAMAAPTASQTGKPQFGLNLRANTSPASGADPVGLGVGVISPAYSQIDRFSFRNGDIVASAPAPDFEKYTLTYIANIDKAQAPGYYATTISLICLANF